MPAIVHRDPDDRARVNVLQLASYRLSVTE
jgi:hypothetical protein